MAKAKDLSGQKFNRLTVLYRSGTDPNGAARWMCLCECGNMKEANTAHLKGNYIQSCGCSKSESSRNTCIKRTKHGARSRENPVYKRLYNVWHDMISRCERPYCHAYENYGGRGITVCEEWHDFSVFKKWAIQSGYDINAPYGVCTIERKDFNKGYNPQNCCWISLSDQHKNRRIARSKDGRFMKVTTPLQKDL